MRGCSAEARRFTWPSAAADAERARKHARPPNPATAREGRRCKLRPVFRKVLIANRGEIAIRIARTLRELNIAVVMVYTPADRQSRHLRFGHEAVLLDGASRGYLDIEALVQAARRLGADAIHPGYGFLSENAELAAACERAGVSFIGPPSAAIAAMASKQRARSLMTAAGVPVVPGGPAETLEEAAATAARIGYPVLIKATDGGGGKGMRRVESASELGAALARTRSEALAAFGSEQVYIEKAILRPRHVEIQVLGDREGTLLSLYERDCSVQRRHQKIIEETPCPALEAGTLQAMCDVALAGARSIGYYSAGTFEFLLSADQSFYFLEMNTRLQVEHPITELVTGLDLVREMLRIAAGERLSDEPVPRRGAAIEARVYAEEPRTGFLPSPGTLHEVIEPSGPFVRVDSGIERGSRVAAEYDPLLAKLSVWGNTREQARTRLLRALGEYAIVGVATNIEYLLRVVESAAFQRGEYDTSFVEAHPELREPRPIAQPDRDDLLAALAALQRFDARAGTPAAPTAHDAALPPWLLVERSRLR